MVFPSICVLDWRIGGDLVECAAQREERKLEFRYELDLYRQDVRAHLYRLEETTNKLVGPEVYHEEWGHSSLVTLT